MFYFKWLDSSGTFSFPLSYQFNCIVCERKQSVIVQKPGNAQQILLLAHQRVTPCNKD